MLERRQTLLQGPAASSPTQTPTKEQTPASPTSPAPAQRTPRSIYREILYLTLVSLGQDNIDLTAFDREYRRAFERLPSKYDGMVHQCDKPPNMQVLFCRKLFRELRL